MQKDLDEHALFKRKLGLYAMDVTILSEFNTINTEQNIAKKIAIMKAIRCNEQIEKQLAKTNNDLIEAKRYEQVEINSIQNDLMKYVYVVASVMLCVVSSSVMETLIDCYVMQIAKLRDSSKRR